MVKLVGHALLLCCIRLNVYDISNTVGNQKGRNFDVTMFYKGQVSFLDGRARTEYIYL